ncbi:unnamed protein product [Prunus armeniaca]
MTEAIYGGILNSENAKEYLKAMTEKFKESDKAETGNMMNRLATMKYDGMEDMKVYLLGMVETASKLKALNVPIADPFLVHLALNSLPSSYGQLKEARIKKEKEVNTVHLTTNAPKRHFSEPGSHTSANKENSKANLPPKSNNVVFTTETVGQKRSLDNEKSTKLWHKRLGHVSKKRMQRLIQEGILPSLNFADFTECVECIKGKMTNSRKLGSTRSQQLLEIIHTDICGPFLVETLEGHRYFITFIDDFSRFCYLYLIQTKSSAFEVFKIFKTEVENQLELKIKVLRSDRGGEYYGNCLIHKPWNSSREWSVRKKEYNLEGYGVQGCKAEAKVYNLNLGNLDLKTVSYMFIGYAKRSKGFHFYCPNYTNRVVETGNAKFLEYDGDSEGANRNFTFDEEEEI